MYMCMCMCMCMYTVYVCVLHANVHIVCYLVQAVLHLLLGRALLALELPVHVFGDERRAAVVLQVDEVLERRLHRSFKTVLCNCSSEVICIMSKSIDYRL